MNSLVGIIHKAEKVIQNNSPIILTALGVSGTVTTAYFAGVASYAAANRIRDKEYYDALENEPLTNREKVELVWDLYIPTAISGALTIGCIIASAKVSSRRAAAAYSVLTVSEKAFEEYREKVVEKLGERKEKAVRDEIAQERVEANPPSTVILAAGGDVLCYELFTGRYFNSDMETLRKAQNDINARLVSELYVTLSDFYYLIGLPYTSYSSQIGWETGKLMALDFSTVLSEDNRPCIAFEYNYTKTL